jgi:hypothetical protein
MRWRIRGHSNNFATGPSCARDAGAQPPGANRATARYVINGSGLIARAFAPFAQQLEGVCIHAAGVANSSCVDAREFARERECLQVALCDAPPAQPFVYFSTCSIEDPDLQASGYVKHKHAMENLVRTRANHLILRLPQLAGHTSNPHTLLNYLRARILDGERFQVWTRARRNVIDVEDAARIALELVLSEHASDETINIAAPESSAMLDIVQAMERTLRRRAVFEAVDCGGSYAIDTRRSASAAKRCGVEFLPGYLGAVVDKYYGPDTHA